MGPGLNVQKNGGRQQDSEERIRMWPNRSKLSPLIAIFIGCVLLIVCERIREQDVSGILVSLVFLGMVLASAIMGGWKYGFLATFMGFFCAAIFFTPPYFSTILSSAKDRWRITAFVLIGVTLSVLCDLLRSAWMRIEFRQRQLEEEVNERRRAQFAEHVRADELMTTLAHIGDGVIRTDSNGCVRFMNPVAEQLSGWTSEQATGRPLPNVFQVLNELTRERVEPAALTALRESRVVKLAQDKVLISHDGKERSIEDSASPIWDAVGNVIGSVLVFRDISERKRDQAALRESEQRYRAIGESIDFGVWICDANGRNTYASDSFLKMVGMTQEECSTFGWASALYPAEAEATVADWKECVRTGARWDREHRFRGVDGNWHYCLSRGVPVRNEEGQITSWVGINLDIDHLKQVEAELRDNDRRKDEFLAILAHELRNPLAPIVNSLHVIKTPNLDPETLQFSLQMIERHVQHLVRLVDDLLDVSRSMRGKIDLCRETVELSAVVTRAVEIAQPLIDQMRHHLEVSVPESSLPLYADPVRLAQAIGNLLTNAAKYTQAPGKIQLIASAQGHQVVLRVCDNGIGIAADMLSHIFDLFVQVDHSTTKSQGGLGVGLTLVRNLIEMHGGTIEAFSPGLGQGSEFVVHLPLMLDRQDQREDDQSEQKSASEPARMKLLVVDDNHDAASSLATLLMLQGHEVEVAYSGQEAIDLALSYLPHLVLLDIGMPYMDGYEVARRLRKTPGLESTVLVALTGWGQADDRRKTAEVGFDHHLMKPLKLPMLQSILDDRKQSLAREPASKR